MKTLNSADRRSLRARAHALHPLVIVGASGLADGVIAEIDRCLKAHELIKIRVVSGDRVQREALLAQVCERAQAAPVQHIGRILVVYRENPEPPAAKKAPVARPSSKAQRQRKPARDDAPRPTPRRQGVRAAARRRP